MDFIDFMILALTIVGAVVGFSRGLVKQLTSLAAFALGVIACHCFGTQAAELFAVIVPESTSWRFAPVSGQVCANILLFLLVMLSVRVAGFFIRKLADVVCLGIVDRVGGVAFAVVKYLFFLSAAINLWFSISPSSDLFTKPHMLNNKPFEATMAIAPAVLGSSTAITDSISARLTPDNPDNPD